MEQPQEQKKRDGRPMVSAVLDDGTIIELCYKPDEHRTCFVVGHGDNWQEVESIDIKGRRCIPYSPENNLLRNDVVLLPSQPEEYGTDEELVAEIQSYLHRYVQLSPLFEKVAAYYALFSWVHDAFNELPYLRARGDFGSGKTRLLLILGSICYKPIFASGASTVSPLFRILDVFRGTLVIDEGDFRMSDEKAEVVKLLNNGNAKGFPVLRTEVTATKELNPKAFYVFGPKLVATRGHFDDPALESRFLTEEMGVGPLRHDIPINLPAEYKQEALRLRNKLLLFRLRNLARCSDVRTEPDRSIEPRLAQIFTPLLAVVKDEGLRTQLRELARGYNNDLKEERSQRTEAQVLEVIRDLRVAGEPLSVKAITSWFADRWSEDYDRKITAKWIGWILRKRLGLKTRKSEGNFMVETTDAVLQPLFDRFGISAGEPASSGTLGTSGTSAAAEEW